MEPTLENALKETLGQPVTEPTGNPKQPKISYIPLIKFIRNYTGCTLREAKFLAEALADANLIKVEATSNLTAVHGYYEVPYPRQR